LKTVPSFWSRATHLQQGARVRIEIISGTEPSLFAGIGHLAGKVKHLPSAAEQHDHISMALQRSHEARPGTERTSEEGGFRALLGYEPDAE
jgi:hypothetical protein